uniref:SWIM-type zinc finger 7 associated protein 1 n=1 Tax=Salvator merianae TaxID=96440 RepID=A0A8D0B623_SALMN
MALESMLLLGDIPAGLRPQPLLLLGPAGSGRSALLFRAALVRAASSPARVLFLAPRPLERLPGGGTAAAGAIQRIHFLYPPCLRELLQLVASLHETFSSSLSLIVLDGLEEYLGSCSSSSEVAHLMALLLDTANHFKQKLSTDSAASCPLIVSMKYPGEALEEEEHLSIVERYISARCWLHPDAEEHSNPDVQDGGKVIKACLSRPGAKDQEWLVRFDPQGNMTISSLPCRCETDSGTVSGKAEEHLVASGFLSLNSGGLQ